MEFDLDISQLRLFSITFHCIWNTSGWKLTGIQNGYFGRLREPNELPKKIIIKTFQIRSVVGGPEEDLHFDHITRSIVLSLIIIKSRLQKHPNKSSGNNIVEVWCIKIYFHAIIQLNKNSFLHYVHEILSLSRVVLLKHNFSFESLLLLVCFTNKI